MSPPVPLQSPLTPEPQHQKALPQTHVQEPRNDDRPMTVYAQRFGVKSPGRVKSWLTPLDPVFPRAWKSKSKRHNTHDDGFTMLRNYQRNQLFHFTTRELKDLDALCDCSLRESTLAEGVVPLLRRERWEDGPSSAWLRRESILIFDALLLGPRRPVDERRYPAGSKIQKEFHIFHPRDGPWTLQRELDVAAERDGSDLPWLDWRVQTFVNVESLEPMFFELDDLSDSERAALVFRAATTVVHEVMHAIAYYQALQRLGPRLLINVREGYYQDEQLAELGWSWQWAMHGGIDAKKPSNNRSRRLLTTFTETTFPSFTSKSFAASNQPILLDPPIPNHSDFYPIGVHFYEDVQTQDFWDLMVRGFGGRIFQYRTLKEGTRVTYDRAHDRGPFLILKRDRLDPLLHDPYEAEDAFFARSMLDIKARMTHTPAERRLMDFASRLAESGRTGAAFWETMGVPLRTVMDIIDILLVGLLLEMQKKRENENVDLDMDAGHGKGIAGSREDFAARRALLAWNRGTRCHALLFSPRRAGELGEEAIDISPYLAQQEEFDVLCEAARAIHHDADSVAGTRICSRLVADRYVGSFVKSAANLLLASCEVEKAGGVEKMALSVRRRYWGLARRGLERLTWLWGEIHRVNVADGWEVWLHEYITWGRRVEAKLRIGPRDVLPDGVELLVEGTEVDRVDWAGARNGIVADAKRSRDQAERLQLARDEMDDMHGIYSDAKESLGADRSRRFKRMKMGMAHPGDLAPD
ncbi:hypothetical protein DSL72_001879 [Monilinia vaccinii-corymbosi]|uniref:Uncharacterized protein n=1 Tax=Monilinia vaccinii-corymbosi TaxID=61207 RepID=A0A8A3PB25_9HELO|nr:hypothetical protein DSL72_001879 [Monilinia vaccinii-corymbosi]